MYPRSYIISFVKTRPVEKNSKPICYGSHRDNRRIPWLTNEIKFLFILQLINWLISLYWKSPYIRHNYKKISSFIITQTDIRFKPAFGAVVLYICICSFVWGEDVTQAQFFVKLTSKCHPPLTKIQRIKQNKNNTLSSDCITLKLPRAS